ncbi:MAG: pentapeptide repeat-containing protein [Pseudonocardia sp.]
MVQNRSTPPKGSRPDPPEAPDRRQPAPAVVESGAVWDCVEADASVSVPEHVADLTLRESRWVDADLSGRRFAGLRCRDTQFVHCDLSGTVLDGAAFTRVTFTNCRLTGTVLSGVELAEANFQEAQLTGTQLHGSTLDDIEGYSGELCGSCKTAVELRRYASDQDR